MAKVVDARDLKSLGGNPVRVRVPVPASSSRLHVATLAIFANAVGVMLFLQARSERFLAAVVDPLHPEWGGMQRAFTGFTVYAVSLLGVIAMLLLLAARSIPRKQQGLSPERRDWRRFLPSAALAVTLTAAVVLVFIEVLIFQDYGIHFYEFDVAGILANAALRRDLGIQPAEVARVTGAALALLVAELVLCFAAVRVARWRSGALPRACGIVLLVGVPGGLTLFRANESMLGAARSEFEGALPLGRPLLLRTESRPHIAVEPRLGPSGYPVLGESDVAPALRRKPNILFYVPDGLRADMIRPELTPNILRFGAREDVIVSGRHFSSGHVSESGVFGLLYALNGHAFHAFIEHRVPAYPIEILKRNGYHTLLLASSRLNPYPTDQLQQTFDEVLHPENDDAALVALDRYLTARRSDGRPYFVLAFFYTPHFPFTSAKPHLRRYPMVGPKSRSNYMNDVIQADEFFRQTLDLVRADVDAGRTAVLVTSDHGEEIRDHGVFGHASATFWNEKVLVPMMLGLPGDRLPPALKHPSMTSHADVWPTLLDYLGATPASDPSTYSDGRSLLRPARPTPALVTGRFFPFADRPSLIVDESRKYWFRAERTDASGALCLEIVRVTDLEDHPLRVDASRMNPATVPAFQSLQQSFWRFLRYAGPQTAPCEGV
jgi:hypothetical protein